MTDSPSATLTRLPSREQVNLAVDRLAEHVVHRLRRADLLHAAAVHGGPEVRLHGPLPGPKTAEKGG